MKFRPAILLMLLAAGAMAKTEGKVYHDSRGHPIRFPLGERSFADEVVSFTSGKPAASSAAARDPKEALGPPNFDDKRKKNFVTLGCGGTLVLRFTDNALIDVPGPDLYVFEVGPDIEKTSLAVSRDGSKWTDVGEISGGTAQIDIAKFVEPGESFTLVRLTDLKSSCHGGFPGADIDAVGAIGGVLQISLKSSVLFDFNESELKAAARDELHNAATQIRSMPDAKIVVAGHTDNVGTNAANQKLSLARAASVRDFLIREEKLEASAIEAKGYGETRPIATNTTDEGREKNRRVEILVIPKV